MSATIGNLQEIGDFLKAHVYTRDFRPVKLTETVKINEDIFVINKDIDGSLKAERNRKLNFDVGFKYIEYVLKNNNYFCSGLFDRYETIRSQWYRDSCTRNIAQW